jgi:hypothetical protein
LYAQGGVAGAYGMIFVGERRTEKRHDAVAHDLVDGALVVMHRLHHALEHRIEQLTRLLRVALDKKLHRALHVCEEHRHLLALAFDPGAEDALG